MPFPLAHPAAVLPLRRQCPRWFNFPALVIGSLCPDIGYCFGRFRLDRFSHRIAGSFEFCLPVGLALVLMFYLVRRPLVHRFPASLRRIFEPLCLRPAGRLYIIVASLLIGAWTHIFLDAATHWNGWIVRHVPVLQRHVIVDGHFFSVHGILYALITFFGAGYVAVIYLNWLEGTVDNPAWIFGGFKWVAAAAFATGTIVLSFANHDLARNAEAIGAGTVMLVVVFFSAMPWALHDRAGAGVDRHRNRKTRFFCAIHSCANLKGGQQK